MYDGNISVSSFQILKSYFFAQKILFLNNISFKEERKHSSKFTLTHKKHDLKNQLTKSGTSLRKSFVHPVVISHILNAILFLPDVAAPKRLCSPTA